MRVVNVSDKPFEWTWDSGIYGPLKPGEVIEVSDPCGAHGVNASQVKDEFGQDTGIFRLKPVNVVKGTAAFEAMVKYPCSICGKEGGVFGKDDLERHMMETHFSKPAAAGQPVSERGGRDSRPFSK